MYIFFYRTYNPFDLTPIFFTPRRNIQLCIQGFNGHII